MGPDGDYPIGEIYPYPFVPKEAHEMKYEPRKVWKSGYQGQDYQVDKPFLVCSCGKEFDPSKYHTDPKIFHMIEVLWSER